MMYPLRTERPLPGCSPARIQLMLKTRDGDPWNLSLSAGMERFVGHYSRVPGLSSDGQLLEYEPTGRVRNG
jgi:hypothetical protein